MNKNPKYDFAGWVTKNDILCSDGVTIRHDAFKDNHGEKVPLVWNHDYNTPTNVLGHVLLENHKTGVYGYGHFNDTQEAKNTKELINHGDIVSMSIGARKIKRDGKNITHGRIYEVSLVLAAANPGATIDTVIKHSDEGDVESGIIYPGTMIHSSEDVLSDPEMSDESLEHKNDGGDKDMADKTVGEILEELTEEQQAAVQILLEAQAEEYEDEDYDDEDDEDEEDDDNDDNEPEGDDEMKHNVFNKSDKSAKEDTIRHQASEGLYRAMTSGASSLKQTLASTMDEDMLEHGINSIEMLFPEATYSNGNQPILYKDPNTSYKFILDNVSKSPFSRVKTLIADVTESEARAKGYITGTLKKEEFFSLIKRSTTPTTVYKKQSIDRDDLVDITDFNVVAFMNREMRMMLEEEIARAIIVGDGRDISAADKINEQNIRPIISDHEFFTIHKQYTSAADFTEILVRAMTEYRGSGVATMFIDPVLLADIKLLKGTDGRYLHGDIPSTAQVANRFGVERVIPTTFMAGKGALVVNLKDYSLGATNGGQITNFDDFDIDFNQHKYLIETRLSGALTLPKSAIHLSATVTTGATDENAGLQYGKREADKVEPEPEG